MRNSIKTGSTMIYRHVFKVREFLHLSDKASLRVFQEAMGWLSDNVSEIHTNRCMFANDSETELWRAMKSRFIDLRCNIDCGFGQFHMMWRSEGPGWKCWYAEFYGPGPSEIVIEADELVILQLKLAVLSA